MKIGILGGTFDPIHEGHLALAGCARDQFLLDKVFFVPAAVSPFKTGQPCGASPEDRLAMLQLALQGHPGFEVSRCELERGGVSYTVDTLRHFHEQFPGAEFFLIMGEDTFAALERWKEPETVRKLARLGVAPRTANPVIKKNSAIFWLNMPHYAASSTEIRSAFLRNPRSASEGIPAAVQDYICTRGLYRKARL